MSLCPLVCSPIEPHGHCISYPCPKTFLPNKLDQSLGQNLSHRTTSLQALVVLWHQAERRQDLSSLSIPILHPSGRIFCTSSHWTASRKSTFGWHFRLAFASGPLAPEAGLGLQPQILVRAPYVFPDVLRTIVDANVHLLERVAHIIMSLLSSVCIFPATNRKPYELETWAGYRCGAARKFIFVCFFCC